MTGRFVAGVPAPPHGPYAADVVILSFERPAETLAAIRSALTQRGVSRHVFVVDQGSCPDTLVQPAGRNDPIPCWAQAARGLPVLVQRNGLARVLLK